GRRYWDEESTPLYPFGHGLSYGSFEYANLVLDRESIAVIAMALFAVTLFIFQKPFSEYRALGARNRELVERNKALVHERNEWDRYIQRLRTDERELIREARRLGYAREGEYLYYFPAE
ncbi:MAG: septum formation initiator family protein, partial [Verrucomicrobiota bacterium]|nr:septum formation initiator family protein [Verrucomicrobiota bacterium]